MPVSALPRALAILATLCTVAIAAAARAQDADGPAEDAPEVEGASADDASDGEADADEPSADEPSADEPRADEPSADEPSADDAPSADEPSADDAPSAGDEPSASSDQGEGSEREEEEEGGEPPLADGEYRLAARIHGEYRHRFIGMSDIPLPPLPRTSAEETGRYGANAWGEQWLRVGGELRLEPILRLVGELDLLWGVAYGDTAIGQGPAAWTREEYGYPGLRFRQLYLEWLTPIGLLRVGQQAFSWGLGIIANGGDTPPPFGDYRFGDLVRRVLFATKPAGPDSSFTVAIAGDWVAYDLIADFERREDLAFQGLVAGFWEEGDDRVGGYVAYRHQTNRLGDELSIVVADLYANLHFDEPSGGRIRVSAEVAYVRGVTTFTRTVEHPEHEVEQLMAVGQIGRVATDLDVIFEAGYASGDSNADDRFQRRATMDPDHRVGLILFPEVLAAMTARSATLAASPETFGRPARGLELLPTNGGVSGAYYLFPYAMWRPLEWLEGRLGMVIAWASTDLVDPYSQRARSRNQSYLGGDPTRRDLGVEFDGAIRARGPIAEGIELSGGVEGGVLIPGRAFDDESGQPMDVVGLLRLRLGIRY
ncbi:MAG: hypothetical protein KF729_18485 [Sandaracinaceae bacterium]|nr:hypothetical protein [Sandaracinaceae bacterium]